MFRRTFSSPADSNALVRKLKGKNYLPQYALSLEEKMSWNGSSHCSCLHVAAGLGDSKTVNDIIESGPGEDFLANRDEDGYTALHYAARWGKDAVVDRLIAASQDLIWLRNQSGRTALHLAAMEGAIEAAGKLAKVGGAELISVKDVSGDTAVDHARKRWRPDLADMLVAIAKKSGGSGGGFGRLSSAEERQAERRAELMRLVEDGGLEIVSDVGDPKLAQRGSRRNPFSKTSASLRESSSASQPDDSPAKGDYSRVLQSVLGVTSRRQSSSCVS